MSYPNILRMARGQTLFDGSPTNSDDGDYARGQEYVVEDTQHGTGRKVVLRAVKNAAGVALEPKRFVRLDVNMLDAEQYSEADADPRVYPVDEAYTANIATNDIFWVVVEGPCLFKTDVAANSNNNFSAGNALVAVTAATSQATTAGRARVQNITSKTAQALINEIQHVIGFAVTARTTNNTDTDTLMIVGKPPY